MRRRECFPWGEGAQVDHRAAASGEDPCVPSLLRQTVPRNLNHTAVLCQTRGSHASLELRILRHYHQTRHERHLTASKVKSFWGPVPHFHNLRVFLNKLANCHSVALEHHLPSSTKGAETEDRRRFSTDKRHHRQLHDETGREPKAELVRYCLRYLTACPCRVGRLA
ncbi:hypothetical protein BR93DRAFT_132028 [Coniochaeta sp. PMI_546]|nr:hypothetical protein BR93DRAFT_132028 [Coniochaeta sp. PMI_546]